MIVIIGLSSCVVGLVGGMGGGVAAYNKNKQAPLQSQVKDAPKLSPENQRLYDHYFLDAMVERQKGNSDEHWKDDSGRISCHHNSFGSYG